jgi:hypothetical protein
MHYFEAYQFFLRGSKWALNLIFGGLCALVPIAGPMVLMGWAFETLQKRTNREGYRSPVFDVNKVGPYLLRGLWPFLVQLVISLPLIMVFVFIWMGLMMGTVLAANPQSGPPRFLLFVFPSYIVGIIVLSVLVQMISLPMCLRAGIMQDFGPAFNVSWAIDFIKRMWAEMLLSMLFFLVTAPIVALLGLLLCCIGVYPAAALTQLAHYHIWFQLYDLYLERGGEAIPVKAELVHPIRDDDVDTHFRPKES